MSNIDPLEAEKRKFQRACALLQILVNADLEEFFEAEEETRRFLKGHGINVPDKRLSHD